MRIFENANYAFISNRKKAYIVSAVLFTVTFLSFAFRGLETGIDFKGGTEFVLQLQKDVDVADIRNVLGGVLGEEPEVKTYGANAVMVRSVATGDVNALKETVLQAVNGAFEGADATVERIDLVGPRFAEDLQRGAIYSIVGSLVVIFAYVLVRFEWRYGIGALASLFHDVILTLGFFSLFHGIVPFSLQIDQTLIAAMLTIAGYSINDTVVVFDRLREFTAMFKTEPYETVVNRSINSTLSRTVVTGGATLLTLIVLIIFGGEVLRGFSVALLIGILVGTYSSVFVAAPVVVEIRNWEAARRK